MTSSKKEYWNSIAEAWEAGGFHMLWRRHSDAVNSKLLRRWLPPRKVGRLLKTDLFDEAVSDGLYNLLCDYGSTIIGIDLSPEIVSAARKRFPGIESHAADVRDLPFENESFDQVVSISTLDHFDSLADIRKATEELTRVLKPGGRLVLTLDNLSNPAVWLRSVLPQSLLLSLKLIPYRVGVTCRPKKLLSLCESAGLEVHESTAILHCPRVLAVNMARLLERRGSESTQQKYLDALMALENLERQPAKFLTGHFIAINASKPVS